MDVPGNMVYKESSFTTPGFVLLKLTLFETRVFSSNFTHRSSLMHAKYHPYGAFSNHIKDLYFGFCTGLVRCCTLTIRIKASWVTSRIIDNTVVG